ncbi:MAG: NADP-dependent isocitrate dehydrogenase, partial [candidate division WOR-3 bacterium]
MNIYVGNISSQLTEEEMNKEFSSYGELTSVRLIKDKFTGENRGFGFVEMPKDEEAEAAIAGLNGKELKTIDALEGEILDGTFMSVAALRAFYKKTIDEAKAEDLIWSVHLKATMMKISDP